MFFGKSNSTSCATLVSILSRYEQASGQCINRAKSAVTFSAKTCAEAKVRVKRELNISNEGGIGKYLGLPEHFGRKKRDIFASILDRIRQKAHGWTVRFLSSAGKMTLLKTVLAAMPTYAMSCFKLPKSLCKQIQSVLTRFWWDMKPELRKMCWISWDKLTLPKSAGGLGFREIEQFNDALLAKHTWRLLKNPESLLGQTLLNKYCRDDNILDVYAPNSASHGWRGILAGREIIKKGLGWSIGNGEKIKVWREFWLSTEQQCGPMGPPTVQAEELRVKDLLLPDGSDWNLEKIRTHLPHYEAQIRRLVPSCSMEDERCWLFEKSGSYTTKSGYILAKLNVSYEQDAFNWKQNVWNVKCSPKIRHFLWKLKTNAMAVGETLLRRGITTDGRCKRCGEMESTFHVMFSCPTAKKVWNLAPEISVPTIYNCLTMSDLLHRCTRMTNLPPVGLSSPLYPWIMWVSWTSRNKFLFEDKSFSEAEIILKAVKLAKEWQAAQPCPGKNSASSKDSITPTQAAQAAQSHQVPQVPPNALVCFSDAAWISSSGDSGLGWIAKDSKGTIQFQGSSSRQFVASALMAEAMALKSGLSMAIASGFKDVVCFTDSKCLVGLLTGQCSVVALKGIIHGIRGMSNSLNSISFQFISRNCNHVADRIAKDVLSVFSISPVGRRNSVMNV